MHVFANKVLEAVAAKQFDLGDGQLIHKDLFDRLYLFPEYHQHPELLSFEQCMMIADMAMYHAKHSGRNRAVYLCGKANDSLKQKLKCGNSQHLSSMRSMNLYLRIGK